MVIAAGTPEEVAAERSSHTGEFLRDLLVPRRKVSSRSRAGKAKKTRANGVSSNGASAAKRKAKSAARG
jgi:hypothetical protein